VVANTLKYILVTRQNVKYGVPDVLLYIVSGQLADTLERCLTIMPSYIIMAKIIPKGIEGTLMAFSTTIVALNQFTIRAILGVIINNSFVNVTTNNLNDYYILTIIALCGSFIPFTYILCMVPKRL
jgi:hypothetical protein